VKQQSKPHGWLAQQKKPVKVVWTRKEEFNMAYFRPAGLIDIRASVNPSGQIEYWEFTNFNSGGSGPEHSVRCGSFEANTFSRRNIPCVRVPIVALQQLPIISRANRSWTSWRNKQSWDPLEFRLKNLRDERLRAVLEAAAKKFGWPGAKKSFGQGFGIAGGFEKGGYIATCAEVAVDRATGGVRVVRLVSAFECGAIVNPDGLRNQVEGANIMGLGGALFEEIGFEDGRILNAAFSKYRVRGQRRAGARNGAPRSQRSPLCWSGRNPNCRRCTRHRKRHLRRNRRPLAVVAYGSQWNETFLICGSAASA